MVPGIPAFSGKEPFCFISTFPSSPGDGQPPRLSRWHHLHFEPFACFPNIKRIFKVLPRVSFVLRRVFVWLGFAQCGSLVCR